MLNLFIHEIRSRWRMILIWGLGLTAWGSIYISIYPEIASEMASFADMEMMIALGMDSTTMEGFIGSVILQVMPIVLGVYVIMMATGTLAGEEDNGTLEMVVAMPLKRWQIVTTKAVALLVVIFLILTIFAAGSALVLQYTTNANEGFEVNLEPMQLFIAMLGTYPLMVAIFGISLFLGAFMPSRRLAMTVMFVLYIGSYVANSAANLVESVEWMHTISLFAYNNTTASAFTDGQAIGDVLVLLGVGVLFFALTLWSFQGRNITVGQWIWQRNQSPA